MQRAPIKLCRYCVDAGKCMTNNNPPSPISIKQGDRLDHALVSTIPIFPAFVVGIVTDQMGQSLGVSAVTGVALFAALRYRVLLKKRAGKGEEVITFKEWLARDRACTVINSPMVLYFSGETTEVPEELVEMRKRIAGLKN